MSIYRTEWPCCGSVTETESYQPVDCPFCKKPSIQNLIDELRKQLPGHSIDLTLVDGDASSCIWATADIDAEEDCGVCIFFGPEEKAKTTDEALAILRKLLGLESASCHHTDTAPVTVMPGAKMCIRCGSILPEGEK